ncbi:DNA alkylation repair protein [Patescibacteria group bacterium]|nr:DNA alkylation repair protein [Patescibacteria group bacterium]
MSVQTDLKKVARKDKVAFLPRLFKTGPGEYGEGDIFWGVSVPVQRKTAKRYAHLSLIELGELLAGPVHECRQTALFILGYQFQKADPAEKKMLYRFYLSRTSAVNNWDLVDCSAHIIVGGYLTEHPKERFILTRLARSQSLWERRIAIVATYAFIRNGDVRETYRIATLLLHDDHDLIRKAVGWMLREAGKCDEPALTSFLDKHCHSMPRTMLRYAIERLPKLTRKRYPGQK